MLRVTLELVPHGQEEYAKVIGRILIANDVSSDSSYYGNYQALVSHDVWSGDPEKFIIVKNFDRRKSAWDLVKMVLSKKPSKPKKNSLYERLKARLLL